jgi:hypothetical protein
MRFAAPNFSRHLFPQAEFFIERLFMEFLLGKPGALPHTISTLIFPKS